MCHNVKQYATSVAIMDVKSESQPTAQQSSKSGFRVNPFRRIAKTARINLNRYWSLLSKLNTRTGPTDNTDDIEVTFAAELEQNRINELLEQRCRMSSTSSDYGHGLLTNHWESDIDGRGPLLSFHHDTVTPSPPPPMRRIRIAKRSLRYTTASPTFSSSSYYSSSYGSSNDSLF